VLSKKKTMSENSTNGRGALTRPGLLPKVSRVLEDVRLLYLQPAVQRAFPVLAAGILVVLGLSLYLLLQAPERTTLFSALPEAEKAAVMDALRSTGTDVQVDPTNGDITVPIADYYNSRMSLAAQGLPQSMPDGYSVLSDMPMGTSRSVENMRLKQSQEIELARSINEIDVILASRVHLAIPERSAFARNAQNPTASVFVQVQPGRSLSQQQVMAVVNLVASSVANLPKTNVTMVDQNGRLLSDTVDNPAATLADSQLEYQLRLERIYNTRVESLLTPIVGPGNISVQVSLDIDFTRTERTEDMVIPDQTALLSEQMALEEDLTGQVGGIPGAVSNTPPQAATLENLAARDEGVANADADGDEGVANADADGKESSRVRSSSNLRNYEVSRTVMSQSSPMTKIKTVHVAVLLREQQPLSEEPNQEGASPPAIGLDPSRIEDVKALVSRAVGINEARGDTLIVASLPFISPEAVISSMNVGTELVWYEDPWVQEMMRNGLMALVLAIVTLGLIKPLLTQFLSASGEGAQAGNLITTEAGDVVDVGNIEIEEGQTLEEIKAKMKPKKSTISAEMLDTANSYDDKVALIRMIVSDEAGRVSNVFKAMMEEDMDQIG
jgi:flagellar M-ring protein FliF